MNYLYGFLSSAFIYSLLHWCFPDKLLDAFVTGNASVGELRQLYDGRWDVIVAEPLDSSDGRVMTKNDKGSEAAITSV